MSRVDGAHGAFDERAHSQNLELRLSMHRRTLAVAAAGVTAGATVLWRVARALRDRRAA